ncbi:MAG: trigger factor [Dysgonamonadaceae bacterium]|jgi:trigger factor|nr:trigger factor [Dysgonamonadaceae bacterium]
MEITLDKIDSLNAILKVNIVQEDYKTTVEKSLSKLRQNADYPGFRKGMVPKEMIKRKYGASVMVDELEKIIHSKLFDYIKENQLNIFGEPLPCETKQQTIDFETQADFEFYYDIAFTPKIEYSVNKDEILPYYTLKIGEEMIDERVKTYQLELGYHQPAEEFSENDFLRGTLTEWENDAPKNNGLVVEDTMIVPSFFKDEEEKAKFNLVKKESTVLFNPTKAQDGNPAKIATILGISKEETEKYPGDFLCEIKEIVHFHEAEINQEFFDAIFPQVEITTEADFREKIKIVMANEYSSYSDNKFLSDFRQSVEKKIGEVQFPEAFLKRWIRISNKQENNDLEAIETAYSETIENLKFQLVKEQLIKEYNISAEADEVRGYIKKELWRFYSHNGAQISNQELEANIDRILEKEDMLLSAVNKVLEIKLGKFLQKQIKLDNKEVSTEEFLKLIQ